MLPLILIVVLAIVMVILIRSMKTQQRPLQYAPPRPGGGSMGRVHQQMDPKAAAGAIYGRLQSSGGLQPGRVYSTAYFQSMMPGPMYGFADDWLWWQAVMVSLNDMMMAGGFGYPAYPYDYGGMNSIYIGNPGDPGLNQMYYGDPTMDQGMPFDPGMGQMIPPDYNPGYEQDQGQGYDPNQGQGFEPGQGNDPNQGQGFDPGQGQDMSGGFDSGVGADSGSGFDSGVGADSGFDSGGSDSGGFDDGGGGGFDN